jgi:hypothetical protein
MNRSLESGSSKTWLIIGIVGIITTLVAVGFLVWALINYIDQRDNVDTKVATAVAEARKVQADQDEAKFQVREKDPNRQFVGPEDYGRLVFDYPKTWSQFVEKDASTGATYQAYLNPVAVPPLSNSTQFALRVLIESRDYDQVINSYQTVVRRGDLTSSTVKADEQTGTRLDGKFSNDIRGSAVIFKIRDKTVTLRTDAETFRADFNALVSSITFNK